MNVRRILLSLPVFVFVLLTYVSINLSVLVFYPAIFLSPAFLLYLGFWIQQLSRDFIRESAVLSHVCSARTETSL